MANWEDVRNFIETGKDIQSIPEGMEVHPVVGVSFIPGYPDNIHSIRRAMETKRQEISINLVRNPNNQYDSNAIEVRSLDLMLGHLSKEVAAKFAPLMDSGKTYKATVYRIRVSPDNPRNPGIDILLGESIE